jgi:RimJ/RimL family protein N-acetyltransferase
MRDKRTLREVELNDGVIALRPFRLQEDAPHHAGDDAEQVRWLSGQPSTLESVTNWIRRNQTYWRAGGPIYTFAIWGQPRNRLVGMVEAHTEGALLDGLAAGETNLSYSLYPEARGHGYAGRAVALVNAFLATLGIQMTVIRVDPRNTPTVKVALRAGFTKTGSIVTTEGTWLDLYRKSLG